MHGTPHFCGILLMYICKELNSLGDGKWKAYIFARENEFLTTMPTKGLFGYLPNKMSAKLNIQRIKYNRIEVQKKK